MVEPSPIVGRSIRHRPRDARCSLIDSYDYGRRSFTALAWILPRDTPQSGPWCIRDEGLPSAGPGFKSARFRVKPLDIDGRPVPSRAIRWRRGALNVDGRGCGRGARHVAVRREHKKQQSQYRAVGARPDGDATQSLRFRFVLSSCISVASFWLATAAPSAAVDVTRNRDTNGGLAPPLQDYVATWAPHVRRLDGISPQKVERVASGSRPTHRNRSSGGARSPAASNARAPARAGLSAISMPIGSYSPPLSHSPPPPAPPPQPSPAPPGPILPTPPPRPAGSPARSAASRTRPSSPPSRR
jgi:hypothetical protein